MEETENINTTPPSSDDLPLGLNPEAEGEDLPVGLEDVTPVSTGKKRNSELGQAAIIDNHVTGNGIAEAFIKLEGEPDSKAALQRKAQEKSLADSDDLEENFVDNPGITPEEMGANAELVRGLQQEVIAQGTNVPRQVVESASALDSDPNIQAKIEGQLRMLQDVSELADSLSGWDIAGDMLGSIFPGAMLKDNMDATGSLFNAEEVMRDMVIGFKSMSAEEQEQAWPAIKEHLLEALPDTRALSTMMSFLDPVGEEQLGDFSVVWAALDTADVALTGFAVANRVAKLTKQLNGIKMLKDLKNTEEATKLNTMALSDTTGEIAEKAGIDQMTAVNNSMPFNVSALDDAYAEGLSTKTLANINRVKEEQARAMSDIADDSKTIREEILTPDERVKAEDEFVKEFTEAGFERITPLERSPDSTTFSYSLVDESGEVLSDTARFDLKLNDVGVWENVENSLLPKWISSPTAWAKGDTKEGAIQALRLDNLSAKVAEQLRRLQRDAAAPLLGKSGLGGLNPSKRSQMAAVDDVLLTGDNLSKQFTVTELKAGVNGVPLNDNQVEVYYNVRSLYDNLYLLRNIGERRKLVSQGMKEVNMLKNQEVGKVFDTPQQAQGAVNLGGSAKIWDDVNSRVITVDKLNLTSLYDEGYVLTKLKNPITIGKDGGDYVTVLTRRNNVKDLPESVLHFKEGYVPRVNKDAYWFLKESKTTMIDGVIPKEPSFVKTHRYFDNRKEADEVLAKFQKENPGKTYAIKEDRELEQQIVGSSNLGSSGGLYTGSRSSDPIGFGRDNMPAERFGAFEALSMNVQGMQQFMTRNQWRMGMEQRWVNTANNLGVNVQKFDPRLAPEGTESGSFLRTMGEQIQEWNGFPSKSEVIWDEKVRAASEWALNSGLSRKNPVVKGLHYLDHKDPIAAMRSSSFHTLLGFLNPAQLWVQAQGASVALTMATRLDDPLGAAKAIRSQFALQAVGHNTGDAVMSHVAKASGMKVDDLKEMQTLWLKTGYEDSILTTADHAASIGNHGIGPEAIRQAADAGLMFYRGGELFNRRTSFITALQEFKLTNKGKKIGDDELKQIMTRANNFMLNLSKANRSGFQKGIASIPTQFLQVQAKMAESLLGLNDLYSRGERAKIVVGQLALYGAAGIPLGDLAVRWYAETNGLKQADMENIDPETVKAVNQGFWGWFALSAFGADVDIANRGAISSGVEQLADDLIFSESTLGETLFGAFGQVPTRFFNAYKELKPYAIANIESGTLPDVATVTKAGNALLKVTSTWNNYQKGVFMREFDMIQNTRGRAVTKPGEVEITAGTTISQMLGFTPSIAGKVRDMDTMNKSIEEHRTHISDQVVETMWSYSKEVDTAESDAERQKIADKYASVQQLLIGSLRTPRDKRLVREQVKRILTGKSKRSKAIKKFIENFNDGRVADIYTIHAGLVSRGLLQVTDQVGDPDVR